ncbi:MULTISPECIES: hypothetical protein [Morganellaceae]|uniref:hypothetical protein n=1 Tax=Morganellaceae TaxID=1903414 RepID=UPI001318E4A0|nr:hypothetical protein [Proteus mirabilis]ELA7212055.1 hypothetical protein [Proteus mirabilis]QHA71107.1 hypothetical protein GO498_12335 [Proteus mirabilis]
MMKPISNEYIKLLGRQMKLRALQVKKPTKKEMLIFYFKIITYPIAAVIAVLVIEGKL